MNFKTQIRDGLLLTTHDFSKILGIKVILDKNIPDNQAHMVSGKNRVVANFDLKLIDGWHGDI